jgi:hypothetical protein
MTRTESDFEGMGCQEGGCGQGVKAEIDVLGALIAHRAFLYESLLRELEAKEKQRI